MTSMHKNVQPNWPGILTFPQVNSTGSEKPKDSAASGDSGGSTASTLGSREKKVPENKQGTLCLPTESYKFSFNGLGSTTDIQKNAEIQSDEIKELNKETDNVKAKVDETIVNILCKQFNNVIELFVKERIANETKIVELEKRVQALENVRKIEEKSNISNAVSEMNVAQPTKTIPFFNQLPTSNYGTPVLMTSVPSVSPVPNNYFMGTRTTPVIQFGSMPAEYLQHNSMHTDHTVPYFKL